jgi:serine/threonine protein kinase
MLQIVHRDLAARNILLDITFTAKIADFGLSRQTDNGYYTRSSANLALPIVWTAPETLETGKVRVHSDRWTYGILLWEIFELATAPYGGFTGDLVRYLKDGNRLEHPKRSPTEM